MRSAAVVFTCLFLPASALAQPAYQGGYIEGFVGLSIISDVDSEEFSFTDGFDDYVLKASIDYGTEVSFGLEAGMDGYPMPNVRIGASWDYINAEFDNVHLSGTRNGMPYSLDATKSDLDALGINLDTAASVVAGHIYLNVPVQSRALQPYIGIGAGATFLEEADTEFALALTAGARTAIGPAAYLGARYRYFYVAGPEDDYGAKYDPLNIHTFSAVIGYSIY